MRGIGEIAWHLVAAARTALGGPSRRVKTMSP